MAENVIFLVVLASIVAVSVSAGFQLSQSKRTEQELFSSYRAAKESIEQINAETYSKRLLNEFGPAKLRFLRAYHTFYRFFINDTAIDPGVDHISLKGSSAIVRFSERIKDGSLDLFSQGMLSASSLLTDVFFNDNVKVRVSTSSYSSELVYAGNRLDRIIKFENITPGEIIMFEFSPKIMEAFDLDKSFIEIVYPGEKE